MHFIKSNLLDKLTKWSKGLSDSQLMSNHRWVVFDSQISSKTTYIFRKNSELLIAQNGKVSKGRWEVIDQDTMLIDTSENSYLLKQTFIDENIMGLKLDGSMDYTIFINESKFDKEINSIEDLNEFLNLKYRLNQNTESGYINPKAIKSLKEVKFHKPTYLGHKQNLSVGIAFLIAGIFITVAGYIEGNLRILLTLIILIVRVMASVSVYKIAKKLNRSSPIWVLLTLISPGIGLITISTFSRKRLLSNQFLNDDDVKLLNLAKKLLSEQDTFGCIDVCSILLERNASNVEVLYLRAKALFEIWEFDMSLEDFQILVTYEKYKPSSLYFIGLIYLNWKDNRTAKKYLEEAAALGHKAAKNKLRNL